MASIDTVIAREILDSRGNPTVEVEVLLDDDIEALIEQRLEDPWERPTGADVVRRRRPAPARVTRQSFPRHPRWRAG